MSSVFSSGPHRGENPDTTILRILQFNNYADPVGGAEVYALALTRELRERGHVVSFFGTHPEREADEELLRIVRRPRYDVNLLHRDPCVRSALEESLRRFRPELVHVHNVFSLGLDVLELLGAAGVAIVQTVHDFSLLCPNAWCVRGDGTPCAGVAGAQCFQHDCQKNYPYDAEVALNTLLKQRILNGAVDAMICPSGYLADLMRAGGGTDVRHLNYFIDPIAGEDTLERKPGELVYIGRLEPEKGVDCLLEAMPRILQGFPGVRLTIVGGGSLAHRLATRCEALGLAPAVRFLSHVPRSELGRFYSTATACVLPSVWSENSPLVAYECLAAGLPMIASRIGGIPELVEEGVAGFTFAARDPADLAEKALRLLALSPDERALMSVRMRARARTFRTPEHVRRIEELYLEVLGRARKPARAAQPIDLDLLTILRHFGEEKARLGAYFREHEAYIRKLEGALAARESSGVPKESEQRPRTADSAFDGPTEPLGLDEPREILQRLARALHLPKVFKR